MSDSKIKPEEGRACAMVLVYLAFVAFAALACGFAFGAEFGFLACAVAALSLLVRAKRLGRRGKGEEGRGE